MAKVKFEYFREMLGVLQIEVPSKGKWRVREPFWHGERIRFLPWSDVRAEPFCHGERIWFLPCQMWVLRHSDVTVGLVPTWSDISVECHSWNGGTWSVTKNTQFGTEVHSDMTMGCSLTWSNMSAWPFWCDGLYQNPITIMWYDILHTYLPWILAFGVDFVICGFCFLTWF